MNRRIKISLEKPHARSIILGLVVAVLIIWGGQRWYFNYGQHHNRPVSHMFEGVLLTVEPSGNLMVAGTFVNDASPSLSDYAHPHAVEVVVTPATKFVKTLLYLPTKAETAKTNGVYYPKDLKKEQVVGSEDDFQGEPHLGLRITSKDAIYVGDKVIVGDEIGYTIPVYPE